MKYSAFIEIEFTAKLIADMFCMLDDEQQTQFFVEVAKIFQTFPMNGDMQTHYIANHLAGCECSSDGARAFVRELVRVIGVSS